MGEEGGHGSELLEEVELRQDGLGNVVEGVELKGASLFDHVHLAPLRNYLVLGYGLYHVSEICIQILEQFVTNSMGAVIISREGPNSPLSL